jgi:Ca-activated chloride channel family protein
VIVSIQQSWSLVKKQADIILLIDISGSMNDEDKIGQVKQASQAFLDKMDANNRVGLVVFNDGVQTLVPLGSVESVKATIKSTIQNLRADGGTAIYDAITQVVGKLNEEKDPDRIRAVVLLSDGADTASSQSSLNDALTTIEASHNTLNPVIFVPVAYGSQADISTLNSIARSSATAVQSGDPKNILRVLEIISSYF